VRLYNTVAGAGFPLLLLPDEDIAEEVRQYVLTGGGLEWPGHGRGGSVDGGGAEAGGGGWSDEWSNGRSVGRAWSTLLATSSNAC